MSIECWDFGVISSAVHTNEIRYCFILRTTVQLKPCATHLYIGVLNRARFVIQPIF